LRLNTGRLRDQWHSMTRTGLVARLFSHSPEAEVNVHPRTLAGLGVPDGSLVRVASRRGGMVMRVRASEDLRPGDAFVAMHWGGRFAGGAGTNALTLGAIDPHSKQPELKHAAVRLDPFSPKWRSLLVGFGRNPNRWLQSFDYASLTLAEAGHETLVALELACAGEPDAGALAALDAEFGLDGAKLLHRDAKRGIEKRVRIEKGMLKAFRFTGDLASAESFRQAMLARSEVTEEGLLSVAPADAAGRAVCSCYGVREGEIRAAVDSGADLARLQKELRCGTSCGSCLPELRRLAAA
jgi:assimilatory nitrate reductase catalytic subunit